MTLRAEGLACGYPGRVVLRDIVLTLSPGEVVALIGPNGIGKSTLLRTLTGYLPAMGGTVAVGDAPLATMTPRERALRIAYVPQMEPPVFDFPVRDVVRMGRTPHGDEGRCEEKVEAALDALGLRDLTERPVTQISGGELQRTLIARALVQEAPLLLLDEPVAHLDLGHQARVMTLLRALSSSPPSRRGGQGGSPPTGVLCVLQHLDLAAEFAERVVLIDPSGRLHAGLPEEVLTEPLLRETFGPELHVGINPITGRPMISICRPSY